MECSIWPSESFSKCGSTMVESTQHPKGKPKMGRIIKDARDNSIGDVPGGIPQIYLYAV